MINQYNDGYEDWENDSLRRRWTVFWWAVIAVTVGAIGLVAYCHPVPAHADTPVVCTFPDGSSSQTLTEAAADFSGPGSSWITAPASPQVLAQAGKLGAPANLDLEHKAVTVAVGHDAKWPPNLVGVGFFDKDGCTIGSVGVSEADAAKLFAPPVDKGPQS